MSITPGRILSGYEILEPIGAGAMGEVWRARDARLGREVALKVLPERIAGDDDRARRFEREARSLAALDHPNVAHVYGIEDAEGTCFIAMELVEGEDLVTRLVRGPLARDEAIDVCGQVAEGLEAAHEAGVVHRDLKPANVRIAPDGRVKLVDFGLAKHAARAAPGSADESALTEPGRVLGTPTYMAPEQVRGKRVDRRADVWAFGCVLYECLTGRRAFDGETLGDVLAAVLESEPDVSALPDWVPDALRGLLRRCLEKDPRRRMRDMGDVRLLLEEAAGAEPARGGSPSHAGARPRVERTIAAALGAAVVLTAAFALWSAARTRGAEAVDRAELWPLVLPAGAELGWRGSSANLSKLGGGSPLLAISADGSRVAFCVDRDGASTIHVQDLGASFASRPIEGTKDGRAPFLSPSGEWLGFFAGGWLLIVSVDGGGAPQKVHGVSSPSFSACWAPDDTIVFATGSGIWRTRTSGDDLERLVAPRRDEGEVEYSGPRLLPDASGVLFTVSTGTASHVARLSLESGDVDVLARDAASPRLLADGRVVYAQGGGIRLLDPADERGRVSEPVLDDVFTTPTPGGAVLAHYDVAEDGTLAYAPAVAGPTRSRLAWADRDGRSEEIVAGLGFWEHPRLSPGGRRIAFDVLDDRGAKDVFVYDLERRSLDRVTSDGTSVMSCWSPRGELTIRSTVRQSRLRMVSPLGELLGEVPVIPGGDLDAMLFADCWAPGGETLFVTRQGPDGRSIWSWTRGEPAPLELVGAENGARFAAVSPDGRRLAHVADERGRPEVFVRPYPELAPRSKVSNDGGTGPAWAPDGAAILYRRGAAMMSAPILEAEPAIRVGAPEVVFGPENPFDWEPGGHRHFDLDRGGRRFLMVEHTAKAPDRIHVVRGWLTELPP